MDYFKALPTEERYRNLNFYQKSVLAYQIEKSKKQEFDFYLSILDSLKMYINPEMYRKELSLRGNKVDSSWDKKNSEFEQHSRTARLYGKPELSPELKKAVEGFKDFSKEESAKAANVGPITVSDINEEEVLG